MRVQILNFVDHSWWSSNSNSIHQFMIKIQHQRSNLVNKVRVIQSPAFFPIGFSDFFTIIATMIILLHPEIGKEYIYALNTGLTLTLLSIFHLRQKNSQILERTTSCRNTYVSHREPWQSKLAFDAIWRSKTPAKLAVLRMDSLTLPYLYPFRTNILIWSYLNLIWQTNFIIIVLL